MRACNGQPRDPEQGHTKPCPLRASCWRYSVHIRKYVEAGRVDIRAPYDFDEETCNEFVDKNDEAQDKETGS